MTKNGVYEYVQR